MRLSNINFLAISVILATQLFPAFASGRTLSNKNIHSCDATEDKASAKKPKKNNSKTIKDHLRKPDISPKKPAKPTAKDIKEKLLPHFKTREQLIRERLAKLLQKPDPKISNASVKYRLDQIIKDARLLAHEAPSPKTKLTSLSLQMQTLYVRISRFPTDEKVDQYLFALRATARRTKAMRQDNAAAIGDFWLLSADLFDINRADLPLPERRRQMRQLMTQYLNTHRDGPATPAVQAAFLKLLRDDKNAKPIKPKTPGKKPKPKKPSNITNPKKPNVKAPTINLPKIPYTLDNKTEKDGIIRYHITSPVQSGRTTLRILLPDKDKLPHPDKPRRILYVLPVEATGKPDWGDGFKVVKKLNLHNKFGLIVVAPSFSQLPWYANHPSRLSVRQESYILGVIVPAIERLIGPNFKKRHLLLGFSKSGWGACHLILKYPNVFYAAAAWDAPLMVQDPNKYGMKIVFPTQKHFAPYYLPKRFVASADMLKKRNRIALLGYDNFQTEMKQAHNLLKKHNIPHIYSDGPKRKHHWEGGWVTDAVNALHQLSK